MSTDLMRAARDGDINALYYVIADDPHALDFFDSQLLVDTPLHIAVGKGNTNFALEIMRLYPSLSKKLDPSGWCPFHVALLKNQIATVFRLLETEPDLVRLKGREGLTSLHLVVEFLGGIEHNLLHEFLAVSPLSITDTTNRGQTALHIAVNNGNIEALKVLLSFLRRSMYRNALYWEHKVLNWKDENGDTVLHVAVKENDIEAVKLLLNSNIKVNARNLDSCTAVDIATVNNKSAMLNVLNKVGAKDGILIEEMKQLTLVAKPTLLDNVIRFVKGQKIDISSETRDALLVAAALVATATFQAVLSPPGGLRQADGSDNDSLPFSKAGKVVKSLLKCNIDVNAKSLEGLTVMDIVDGVNNNPDMKDVLIQAGAKYSHVMNNNDINSIPSMKQPLSKRFSAHWEGFDTRQADGSNSDSLPFSKVGKKPSWFRAQPRTKLNPSVNIKASAGVRKEDIVVVGAGIADLATAVSLRRSAKQK
ncbi:hypothetical protein J1N35_009090 [Gossypium stocksii]|uniref:PGG domain-containing protein n=1 Tax=Gossypium stocksii TaxID=47602 RepID=A0A9D3WAP8_9ROSI|nr:hypothetical protein J1N35_009090 [Gossypium stocksii]